jgi:hypothetical protein
VAGPLKRRDVDGRAGRREYRQDELVVLPPIEVPLDAEHERRALIALAELLAPLFATGELASEHPSHADTQRSGEDGRQSSDEPVVASLEVATGQSLAAPGGLDTRQ